MRASSCSCVPGKGICCALKRFCRESLCRQQQHQQQQQQGRSGRSTWASAVQNLPPPHKRTAGVPPVASLTTASREPESLPGADCTHVHYFRWAGPCMHKPCVFESSYQNPWVLCAMSASQLLTQLLTQHHHRQLTSAGRTAAAPTAGCQTCAAADPSLPGCWPEVAAARRQCQT